MSVGLAYHTGAFSRASAQVINTTTEPDTLALTAGDTQQETTSIGVEVGWSTGLDILGFANTKISATVTGGHSWSTTDTTSTTDTITIPPAT